MTVEVMEAALPPRLGALSRKEKPLHPYAAVVVGAAGTGVGCCRRRCASSRSCAALSYLHSASSKCARLSLRGLLVSCVTLESPDADC